MPKTFKDPLLTAATVATVLARIALAIGMIGLAAALAAAVFRPDLLATPPLIGIGSGKQDDIPVAALVIVALTIAAFALLYDFAARLARIIATVRHGDPLTLANAARLSRMAWLAMSVQGINIAQTLMSMYLPNTGMDTHMSLTGLAVGLVLFILARVFRYGATMREELEGTV
ncbi:MAG TPA: DUF2975 domain-containing protein [Sphingomonadaceae bacterium]|nr:DUF2975 domain-containing protein [Sphingomonadaceae bacterium]